MLSDAAALFPVDPPALGRLVFRAHGRGDLDADATELADVAEQKL